MLASKLDFVTPHAGNGVERHDRLRTEGIGRATARRCDRDRSSERGIAGRGGQLDAGLDDDHVVDGAVGQPADRGVVAVGVVDDGLAGFEEVVIGEHNRVVDNDFVAGKGNRTGGWREIDGGRVVIVEQTDRDPVGLTNVCQLHVGGRAQIVE